MQPGGSIDSLLEVVEVSALDDVVELVEVLVVESLDAKVSSEVIDDEVVLGSGGGTHTSPVVSPATPSGGKHPVAMATHASVASPRLR
jgi:hypothetical protein